MGLIPSLPCIFLYLLVLLYKYLETIPSHSPSGAELFWGFILFVTYMVSISISALSSIIGVIIGFIILGVSYKNEHEDKRALAYVMLLLSSISVVLTWLVISDILDMM